MSLRVVPKMLIALLLVVYAAQIVSPLRLNTDSIKYLAMADSAARGAGFLHQGVVPNAPRGYPTIVLLMDRAGVATAAWLIGLQVVLIAGFSALSFVLLREGLNRSTAEAGWIVAILLGSYFTLKHTVLPLADNAYDVCSMATLVLMVRSRTSGGGRRIMLLIASAGAACLAISMRVIGIAMLPAIFWEAVSPVAAGLPARAMRRWTVIAVLVGGACFVVGALIVGHVYLRDAVEIYKAAGPLTALAEGVWETMIEVGSIVMNVPSQAVWMDCLIVPIGAAVITTLAVDLWRRRRSIDGLDVYLAIFGSILLVWASNGDPRLWVPVFPIVLSRLWGGVRPNLGRPMVRIGLGGAATIYVAFAMIGILVTTRTSWSGQRFPEHVPDAMYRNSYRVAFGSRLAIDQNGIDPEIVELLHRHDPRHAIGGATRP